MRRVGVLNGQSPDWWSPYVTAFRQGLKETAYLEDQNVAVEYGQKVISIECGSKWSAALLKSIIVSCYVETMCGRRRQQGMTKAAIAGAATDEATIRKIAEEAFTALNSGGRHVLPFSARYPAFSLSDAYRVTALANDMRVAQRYKPLGRKIGFTNR